MINPYDYDALEGIDNLKSELIERWHFRMLNDTQRNNNYNEAIKEYYLLYIVQLIKLKVQF